MKTPRKTILITGASSGIGAATALMAARRGYNVAIHYRSDAKAAQLVAHMAEEAGAETHVFKADVGIPEEVERLFEEFDSKFATLDGLVNNAGMVDVAARLDEMSAERITRIVNVNLVGALLVAKEAVLRMSQAYGGDGGSIVNISSAAARLGAAGQYVDYAASKGAIDTLTIGLANEVAREGIRVTAIRPGIIETAIHAKGGEPDRAERLAHTVPMARAGTAEECAEAIMFLLSEQSSYVTGTILDVSGGR
jgi:NAD(P)-dependent dehydrogenase (short-subunit alcohol dehydrogenase family)